MASCAVEGCETKRDARGYCPSHYNRWKRYGDPLGAPQVKPDRGCAVEECDRPHRSWGYCNMHAQRLHKHGDPTKVIVASRKLCSVDSCGTMARYSGHCVKHWRRVKATGSPFTVRRGGRPPLGEHPGWDAIHFRLRRDKGKAALFSCIDCGGQAKEWSYDNEDPNQLTDMKTGMAYSLSQDRYAPRCVKCHRDFDRNKKDGAAHMVLTVTDIGENE